MLHVLIKRLLRRRKALSEPGNVGVLGWGGREMGGWVLGINERRVR